MPRMPLVLVAVVLGLAGCSAEQVRIPGIYRIDVQQGNVVDAEMLAQVEPGMDARKVRFLLGTPLLIDTFNPNRWDYYYSYLQGNGELARQRITLVFENDVLARIEGEPSAVTDLPGSTRGQVVVVPPGSPDEGLLAALVPDVLRDEPRRRRRQPDEAPAGATAAPAEPTTAAASPLPASPPPAASEDTGFYRQVLSGYGREDAPAAARPASAPEDRATAGESPTDDAGFFRRMLERFRANEGGVDATTPTPTRSPGDTR